MSDNSAGRFDTLDLLRGVAALAVVAFHFHPGTSPLLAHGYLAVDLFFALSGFVIAHAYGRQLMNGEPVGRFMLRRLIRLYPLYLFATLIGAVLILDDRLPGGSPAQSFHHWLFGLAANLLFLPAQPNNAGEASQLFPALVPAWSLFWELLANFVYGLVAARLGGRSLVAILLVGFALLAATGAHYGTLEAGAEWRSFWGGGGRVVWSFFAGVALQRLYVHMPPARTASGWLLAAILIAALAQPQIGWGYDVLIVVLMPMLIWFGARPGSVSPVGHWLGYVSYALYVVHVPLMHLLTRVMSGLIGPARNVFDQLFELAFFLGVSLVAAAWVSRSIDDPLRGWLSRTARPFLRARPNSSVMSIPSSQGQIEA